ncbi:MAG TPA: hypothetical protein VHI52_04470, partial [Verrucomicrobiae bacterium]|nr:hypothetical protein [Verrucomicrobiae bacterium]
SFTGSNPFIALTGPFPMTVSGLFESDAPLTISNTSNGTFTFSANIIAPQVVLTAGSIHFTVPNTLPNGITISHGTGFVNLTIDDDDCLGAGPLTYNFTAPQQSSTLTLPTSIGSFNNALIINAPVTGNDTVNLFSPNTGTVASWAFPSLTVNGSAGIATQQQGILSIASVSITGSLRAFGSFNLSNISGTGSLSADFGTLTLNTANTYLGGTTALSNGSIIANVPGALSTGPVALASLSQLFLNATAAANADITLAPGDTIGGSIFYNANAAANGHNLTANSIALNPNITSLGGDTFAITTNGSITGNAGTFSLLTRGGNLTLSPGATLIATDGAVPDVQNLGSAADVFFGFTDYHAINVTVGAGTPWAGVSGTFAGTITANSDFTLSSVYFFANILASSPVHVTITGQSDFSRSLANLSGVSLFTVGNGATLAFESDHVLGGGSNTAPAALDVPAGATLAFQGSSSAALNGPVTLHAGSTVNFTYQFSGGLTGSGAISRDSGPI